MRLTCGHCGGERQRPLSPLCVSCARKLSVAQAQRAHKWEERLARTLPKCVICGAPKGGIGIPLYGDPRCVACIETGRRTPA